MQENWKNKYIVFFDGECGVCNFWVQWILERDKRDQFMFASLQSDFGQQFLADRNLNPLVLDTMYLWKPDEYFLSKSQAVIKIASLLGGFYRLLLIARIFPPDFGDKIYSKVSENRIKLSSQKCFLPDLNEKRKFIEV